MRLVRPVCAALVCLALIVAVSLLRRRSAPAAPSTSAVAPAASAKPRTDIPPAAGTPGAAFAARVGAPRAREAALARTHAFNDWLLAWRRADAATQATLASHGRTLAAARRDALAYLIQTDPKLALSLAVHPGVRHELPADVQALLENQVDTRGQLDVAIQCFDAATPGEHRDAIERVVQAGDSRWHAHVFGRRETQTSQPSLPLHGIAIGAELALSDEPYRVLDAAEDGYTPATDEFAVRVGREIMRLRGPAALAALRTSLVAAESQPGPAAPATAAALPVGWSTGVKRVLFIRADFPDATGSAMTDADINAGVASASAFYQDITQGQTSLTVTILPGVFRMPNNQVYYDTTPFALDDMGDDLAKRAHDYDVANGGTGLYDPDRADRWVIVFPHIPATGYAGVGIVGGKGIWMNGAFTDATLAHELGHNNGVWHSHAWKVTSGAPLATTGEHVEYGDPLDIMGTSRVLSAAAFNAPQKVILGYLPETAVTTVTTGGTYRLYRHDHASASGVRALRISSTIYDYWLDYRRVATSEYSADRATALQNGVQVHVTNRPWFMDGYGPYLIDMNPDAQGDMTDAGLALNRTYTDAEAGLSFTPVAVGGSSPNEYIDMKIDFGAVSPNRDPAIASTPSSTTLTARTNVTFSATASDPDNDPVQYRWDFGDRRENPTTATQTHRWLKGGNFTVTAAALDGKGGRSVVTYPVTVSDPFLQWTPRAQEIVTSQGYLTGIYAGGKFVFAGSNGLMSVSNDGLSWSSITVPGGPPLMVYGLAHNGSRFVAVGYHSIGSPALWSNDGVTWQTTPMPGSPNLKAAAASATSFVAVGDGGKIYQSADGMTWAAVTSPVTDNLLSVSFANNLFVAVGMNGRVLTSADGITWANRTLPKPHALHVVARAGNLWYATPGTYVWTSPDAITWTLQSESPNTNVQSMTSTSDGTLVAVTSEGTMVWTEGLLPWESVTIDPVRPTELHGSMAVGNGLVVVGGFDGRVYTVGTPTLAAPLLRDLRVVPQVQAGRANPVAISGQTYSKLELLVDGQVVNQNDGSAALSWSPTRFGTYQVAARGTIAGGTTVTSNAQTVTADYSDWSWSSPLPFTTSLTGGVRVNDRWYITGGAGGIYTVDDAGNATRANTRTNEKFTDIDYANGRFVATSEAFDRARETSGFGLWSSSDGITWSPATATIEESTSCIAYGPGLWVAAGQIIRTSTDGINWTRLTPPAGVQTYLYDVAYGAGQWILVGSNGVILASTDGATWTTRTSGTTESLTGVAYREGHWVAAGMNGVILHSTDAATWSRVTVASFANDHASGVARTGTGFVLDTTGGAALVSNDGLTWTAATKPSGSQPFSGIATDGTNVLLLGTYGSYLAPAAAANTWARPPVFRTAPEARQVIYANGRFVAVGDSVDAETSVVGSPINVSSDGFTWSPAVDASGQAIYLYGVAWNGQLFVAAGGNGVIYTSSNGLTWTRVNGVSGELRGVASTTNSYVAVGLSGVVRSSVDGATWVTRTSGTSQRLAGVVYGSGGYLAVGDAGTILSSPDGIAWTARTSGTTNNLSVVAVVTGVGYAAAGFGGSYLTSPDGVTWTSRNIGLPQFETATSITDTPQGTIVTSGLNGLALFSGDNTSWVKSSLPSDRSITSFAVGPTSIVAVGSRGLYLTQSRAQRLIATSPTTRDATAGGTTTFSAGSVAVSDASYQWQRNGAALGGAISPTLTLGNIQPANTGIYFATTTSASLTSTTAPAILGLATTSKVIGTGSEIASNIVHPVTGFTYDQILLDGSAATFTADSAQNQITRLSYIDLTNDIIQVEFSGHGSVSIVLDNPTGPATPINYNQSVSYMKGHAGIVVTGADETTNLSVFSVGRGTASNSALFKSDVTYDGIADIAFIAITSTNGKFGGLRTANANYFATRGITGVYAPGVQFTGPVFVGDIGAQDNATPYLVIGSGSDVRVTGGDMLQANNRAVVVSGITQLKFTAGSTSHFIDLATTPTQLLAAKTNKGRFEQNGVDVTSQIVVPSP